MIVFSVTLHHHYCQSGECAADGLGEISGGDRAGCHGGAAQSQQVSLHTERRGPHHDVRETFSLV